MIGDKLIILDKIDSTNQYIKENWEKLPSETVVWALEQKMGYGRRKNFWHSPLGGLWFSVLFKPKKRPLIPYYYVRMYSLVIFDLLKKKYNLKPVIKWPNDILVNEKKICGILGESVYKGNNPVCVIVGVGLNVNNELPSEISNKAISLKELLGREISLKKILNQINHIAYNSYYLKYFKPKALNGLTKIWFKHLNIKPGDRISLKYNEDIIYGKLLEIKSESLVVLTNKGEIKEFNSGEISVLK